MKFIAIDFEATDKIPETARPTEIAAVMCEISDADDGMLIQRIAGMSSFIYAMDYPPQSEEVLNVTGITDEMLKEQGRSFHSVMNDLFTWDVPDFFVAHNKGYDEVLFKKEVERQALPYALGNRFYPVPWICTMNDIEHSPRLKCRKLSHLALDYGVPVDPKDLHRAMGDVEVLLKMLDYGQIDLRQVVERMKIPDVFIRAIIPKPWEDGDKGKNAARACGFGWQKAPGTDGPTYPNSWVKRVKQDRVDAEKEKLGYKIEVLY